MQQQPQQPMRMPRYDVRNDGAGPYAVFYCEKCDREYRSRPDLGATITQDVTRRAAGGFLRGMLGSIAADAISGPDPRYSRTLTPQQLDAHWQQVLENYRQCPTCLLTVCLSCFDTQSGYCKDDSPRKAEIAQAQAEQGAAVIKGIANVFGLGEAVKKATEAAQTAQAEMARCPKDGTLAPAGTKFCSECGSPMIQPVQPTVDRCQSCGAEVKGAKFCPECGAKIERAAPAPAKCPSCGTEVKGAKFCPECGTKVG
jgi:hypothetical protein